MGDSNLLLLKVSDSIINAKKKAVNTRKKALFPVRIFSSPPFTIFCCRHVQWFLGISGACTGIIGE
jgi:hypothetical protein